MRLPMRVHPPVPCGSTSTFGAGRATGHNGPHRSPTQTTATARRRRWGSAGIALGWRMQASLILLLAVATVLAPLTSGGAGTRAQTTAAGSAERDSDTAGVMLAVLPSVVSITTGSASPALSATDYWGLPTTGRGAGFVFDAQGHLVTNYHVVGTDDAVEIVLASGTTVPGSVIGRDPTSDLAVVRAPALVGRVRSLPLGDSRTLRAGDQAIAVGDPFGYRQTVTVGVVSGLGRILRAPDRGMMTSIIQIDAAVGPGSSGGPLLNSKGEVVGVMVASVGPGAAFGFAIPSVRVKRVVPELIATGLVAYGWLGIIYADGDRSQAGRLGRSDASGVAIGRVIPGSPASQVGLRGACPDGQDAGDRIVAVAGRPVLAPEDLTGFIRDEARPGDPVRLTILRAGRRLEYVVSLAGRPVSSAFADEPAGPDVAGPEGW